ncbi:MAG: DUF58 domain-containing protein [Haloarculaceae archaeon]
MRLTRRGWGALVVVALAYTAAYLAGARALNAIAAPILAALVVGAVLVWRAEEPSLTYGSLQSGHPGQTRTLHVDVNGGGLVTLAQPLPDGIEATAIDATVTPPHSLERVLTLADRGIYRLAAPTVRQRDPLGLVSRRVDVDADLEVVVYPSVATTDDVRLSQLFADELAAERQEFDRLREYASGDPLKNVHWKSSAKYDDFLVMEFAPAQRTESVHIVADATPGNADAMASAAATLALGALDAGLSVALTVPGERVPSGTGTAHRESLLRVLAGVRSGTVPSSVHDEADISIRAESANPRVHVGDRTEQFDNLKTTTSRPVGEVSV